MSEAIHQIKNRLKKEIDEVEYKIYEDIDLLFNESNDCNVSSLEKRSLFLSGLALGASHGYDAASSIAEKIPGKIVGGTIAASAIEAVGTTMGSIAGIKYTREHLDQQALECDAGLAKKNNKTYLAHLLNCTQFFNIIGECGRMHALTIRASYGLKLLNSLTLQEHIF